MTTPGPSNRKAQAQEAKEYRMDTTPGEELHVDLKRDTGLHSWTARNNQTMVDGPLFEKYQFLTPGTVANSRPDFLPSLTNCRRYLHGISGWSTSTLHIVRRYLRSGEPTSLICGVRQREWPSCTKEGSVTLYKSPPFLCISVCHWSTSAPLRLECFK